MDAPVGTTGGGNEGIGAELLPGNTEGGRAAAPVKGEKGVGDGPPLIEPGTLTAGKAGAAKAGSGSGGLATSGISSAGGGSEASTSGGGAP